MYLIISRPLFYENRNTTLNAAIQFVQWSIKQARLLYADLGISEHQDSAKVTRFVERFRYADWITARQVRSWTSARQKPSCDECRQFMQQIVTMGYATNNGEIGRKYKIKILTCSLFSHFDPQIQTGHTFEGSHDSSTELVTLVTFNQNSCHNLGNAGTHGESICNLSVESEFSRLTQNSGFESDYDDYGETTKLTTLKSSQGEDLNPIVTKVTTPINISIEDRVRYRGKGENGLFTIKGLKTDELTVVAISNDMVEVSNPRWVTTQNIPARDLEKI